MDAYDRALVLLGDIRAENHPDTLACLSNRAKILNDLGRAEEAESQLLDLLERRRAVFGPRLERVGITLNNLADSLRARGAYEEPGQLFNEAIAIFRENPGDPSLCLAITIHNAGVMLLEQPNTEQARGMLREAAEMRAALLPPGHWIAAQFRVKWAECLLLDGERDVAIEMLNRSRTELVASLGEEHRRVQHVDMLLEE